MSIRPIQGMVLALVMACVAPSFAAKVAIHQFADHPALNLIVSGLCDELQRLEGELQEKIEIELANAQGQSVMSVQVAQNLMNHKPDIVVAVPTPSAQVLLPLTKGKNIPMIFSGVTDPIAAGIMQQTQNGEEYVTGLIDLTEMDMHLDFMLSIQPGIKKLGVLNNPTEANSCVLVEHLRHFGAQRGLEIAVATIHKSSDVPLAMRHLLSKGVDAVFQQGDNTAASAHGAMLAACVQEKVPLYVCCDGLVSQGAVGAYCQSEYESGRQTATMVIEAIKKGGVKNIAPQRPKKRQVFINRKILEFFSLQLPQGLHEEIVFVGGGEHD